MMKLVPYHILEVKKELFLYVTSLCQFYRIDIPTAEFLNLCLEHSFEEAKERFIKLDKYSKNIVNEVIIDVSQLVKQGLFSVPDYSISVSDMEKQLEQRYSTTWNKLELALSEACNLACKYCYCSTVRNMPQQGLMNEEIARLAITWLFAVSGKSENISITFFGGEPLLNKSVLRFAINYSQQLAKLHGKKVFYSMTTNGTLLDDEVITFIKRYNFGLMVSLDGPPEIHNRQCPTQGGDGSYDLAVKGIRKLMARRRSVTVRCTMTHPIPNMLDLIKFFEEFGFTRIVLGRTVNPVLPSPMDFREDDFVEALRQEREEIIPWIIQKLAKDETPKYFPYANFIDNQEKGELSQPINNPFRCGACRGTTTVGADGTLYPCHRFVGMEAWKIGDIKSGPDYEKCKQFWRNYRKSIAGYCDKCWMWAQCHGPCPWEIAQADGSFKLNPKQCKQTEDYLASACYVLFKKMDLSAADTGFSKSNMGNK